MKDFYPEGMLIGTPENRHALSSRERLTAAANSEKILEGTVVMCDTAHDLIVDLGIMRGVIPRVEGAVGIAEGTTRDIALISRVGKAVSFVITGFAADARGRTYAQLSRRKAQEKCRRQFLSHLSVGDVIDAKVTHLETFGAFCDIGCGNAALLPIDSISVSRISHPKDRFCVGDNIRVAVKCIENGKITLTMKELLGTWQENADLFTAGQTVTGVIRSIEEYGIFVELTPNLAGLAEPRPDVYIGSRACVYIKSINPEKMKIKLVLIDSFESEEKTPIRYFFEGDHIDEFDYSPENSYKCIRSCFCEEKAP